MPGPGAAHIHTAREPRTTNIRQCALDKQLATCLWAPRSRELLCAAESESDSRYSRPRASQPCAQCKLCDDPKLPGLLPHHPPTGSVFQPPRRRRFHPPRLDRAKITRIATFRLKLRAPGGPVPAGPSQDSDGPVGPCLGAGQNSGRHVIPAPHAVVGANKPPGGRCNSGKGVGREGGRKQ